MASDVEEPIADAAPLGSVTWSRWQSYTWKNELAEQKRRISLHLEEVFAEADTEHNPYHMLERAIGVAALCMRRLIECRLVTDRFRESQLAVNEIPARSDVKWRETFVSDTAGAIFDHYDLQVRRIERRTPKVIADKLFHARVIAVLAGSTHLPNGLLIASDTQRKVSLFHFTASEIAAVFDAFLTDQVRVTIDRYADAEVHGLTRVVARRG